MPTITLTWTDAPKSKKQGRETHATTSDPILGEVPVMSRTDREIDELRIARARACLARAPAGSKFAQVYAAQVAGIASGYQKGSI